MTTPRRRRPSPEERVRNTLASHSPLNAQGGIKSARPVTAHPTPALRAPLEVVSHGDDPDVPRPIANQVHWVGAATPNNAEPWDFWYPANLDEA